MRIIKARKAKYGFELPAPDSLNSIRILSEIGKFVEGRPATFQSNVSNGTATYNLYTDDDILGKDLTNYYKSKGY